MEQRGLLASEGESGQVFYTTSDAAEFVQTLQQLTGANSDVRLARWEGGQVTQQRIEDGTNRG